MTSSRALAPANLFDLPGTQAVRATRRGVIEIDGVGEHYAQKLRQLGIVTIGDLIAADRSEVASRLDVPSGVVDKWCAMADLLDVDGVGPHLAELLVRCGIGSIDELARCNVEDLLARVLLASSERMLRIQGLPVDRRHVEEWIAAARQRSAAS